MISIIVITHNRVNYIKDCLDSLLNQRNTEKEIIVVDNASGDKTCEMIKNSYGDSVKLIRLNTGKNLAYCKRLGFKNSYGDIVAFTDDDCIVSDGWLSNIKNGLNNNGYDIIAGPVRMFKKMKFPWWWQDSLNWTIGIADIDDPRFVPLGCNVAFKRHIIDDIMSDKMNQANKPPSIYAEDTLRMKKAAAKGYKLRLEKSLVVYHNIDTRKISFKYLIYRSWLEGRHWAQNEKSIKILLMRVMAVLINPFRFIISLRLHHLLRSIVSMSYIVNFFY